MALGSVVQSTVEVRNSSETGEGQRSMQPKLDDTGTFSLELTYSIKQHTLAVIVSLAAFSYLHLS